MSGAMIYISDFQNKLAWKFGISVQNPLTPLMLGYDCMGFTVWFFLLASMLYNPHLNITFTIMKQPLNQNWTEFVRFAWARLNLS